MQTSFAQSGPAWPPTRAEALRRLENFAPHAGRDYAAQRNYDRGPADRSNVSTLSPYLRRRIVSETEVLGAVLARHSRSAAEKFVAEVFWRTYWKGWLEAHPAAWSRYRAALDERFAALDATPAAAGAYAAAVGGQTGIDAFDAWAHELTATNYLHNHARMWFASIWIFTLQLPWELGADFFMRYLLDGDPASNTLSWRWVAGLHTRGRTYAATRDNIRRYTGDRFAVTRPLAGRTAPLDDPAIPVEPLPPLTTSIAGAEATLLLVHDDDLGADLGALPAGIGGVAALRADAGKSPRPVSPAVVAFGDAAAGEATQRLADAAGARDLGAIPDDAGSAPAALTAAAERCGATRIVAAFAPVGPAREMLDAVRAAAREAGLSYAELARPYDAAAWPAATRGFFQLRARIPAILAELGVASG